MVSKRRRGVIEEDLLWRVRDVRHAIYSEREIIESLGDAELSVVEVIDFDPYNEAEELAAAGVKLLFVVRPV